MPSNKQTENQKKREKEALDFSLFSYRTNTINLDNENQEDAVHEHIAEAGSLLSMPKTVKAKTKKEKPHFHGHRARLRERVLSNIHGVESYEILELLLGYVFSRTDTKPLAKELLDKFGSLWGVLNAHPTELDTVGNLGPSTKIFFTVLREVVARYFVEPIKVKKTVSIEEIVVLARAKMDGLTHEEVWLALLDNNNRLLDFVKLSGGTAEEVPFNAKMVAEVAFAKKATALVLVHNHPGGTRTPSWSDIEETKKIQNLLKQMDIRLLEHLILADGHIISFMNNHVIEKEKVDSFFNDD